MFELEVAKRIKAGDEVAMRRNGEGAPADVVVLDFRTTKQQRGVRQEVYVEHEDGNCEWIPKGWITQADLSPRESELLEYKREITRVYEECIEERVCGECGRQATAVSYRTRDDHSRYAKRWTCAEHTPQNVSIRRTPRED